jgi:hypothetical protein
MNLHIFLALWDLFSKKNMIFYETNKKFDLKGEFWT